MKLDKLSEKLDYYQDELDKYRTQIQEWREQGLTETPKSLPKEPCQMT